MRSNQDGQGVPPYAAETAREIATLDAGGHGNFEKLSDAERRGITPALVAQTAQRAERAEAAKHQAGPPKAGRP